MGRFKKKNNFRFTRFFSSITRYCDDDQRQRLTSEHLSDLVRHSTSNEFSDGVKNIIQDAIKWNKNTIINAAWMSFFINRISYIVLHCVYGLNLRYAAFLVWEMHIFNTFLLLASNTLCCSPNTASNMRQLRKTWKEKLRTTRAILISAVKVVRTKGRPWSNRIALVIMYFMYFCFDEKYVNIYVSSAIPAPKCYSQTGLSYVIVRLYRFV